MYDSLTEEKMNKNEVCFFNIKRTFVKYHTFGATRLVCFIRDMIKINFHSIWVMPCLLDDLLSC